MFTVALYRTQRAYGGPEEGGWWYDCGEPVLGEAWAFALIRHFLDEDEAWGYWQYLKDEVVPQHNAHLPPIHSVDSDGVYSAQIRDGYALEPYPTRRPHYE